MMDFEAQDGNEFEDANLIQASGNAAPPPVARAAASQVLTANAQGVIILPEGVSLEDIQVEGRNLVVIGDDGTRYIIIDGAIVVPQLVIDGVAVPPVNLAALLLGNEPEPAAGNPQSSGGNFAGAVGDIQAAFDLGNLLPYTELQFPADEEREIIPDVVDRDPGTLIVTPNNPAGAVMATASVDEAGLPARNNEPPGSNSASNSETTTGTIVYTAPDGLDWVSLNGVVITAPGQTVAGAFGTLTVTSVAAGSIGYTYTLADNTLTAANEVFTVTVREVDGDIASASLTISIVDDAPTARNDTDSVPASTFTGQTGNVVTGLGTTSGAAGADTQGADGATVTGIHAGTAGTFAAPGTVNGQYGTLSINAQGTYTYTRSANTPGGVSDVFTYRFTDGDGDVSTATLTIAIGDAPVTIISVPTTGAGTVVDEEGLPARPNETPGSNEAADVETTAGTITFSAPDGVASVAINGTTVTGPGQPIATPQGTLTVVTYDPDAGTLGYTFTLADNTSGDSTQVDLSVTVTDLDGDSDTEPFVITIVDDEPTARADADSVTEDGPTVADGNVITGTGGSDLNASDGVADTRGADGASVTAVAFGATAGTVGTPLAGAYGSLTLGADGSYTYTLNNGHPLVQGLDGNDTLSETFSYTLTDGDGDASATTLTITINGANDVVVINGLDGSGAEETVDEDDLADGSSPDAAALTQSGTFTIDSPDGLAALTVDGTAVFGTGVVYPVTFSTAYGTMSITGVATTTDANGDVTAATVSYSYTLTDNTLLHTGANGISLTESFAVAATDSDGSTDTASLDVTVIDDVPTALSDADSVTEDGAVVADGNVITGSGGADINTTDGVTDTQGADGAAVTTVAFGATNGTVGSPLAGAYGSLTLNADGSYTYTLNNAHPLVQGLDGSDTLTEIFNYRLTDGDGDSSPATLTISINGTDDGVVIGGLDVRGGEEVVYEDDLADGSSPDATQLTQTGAFTVDSQDGLVTLTVNGTSVFGAGVTYPVTFSTAYGTMSITGVATTTDANGDVVAATVSYSYTLTDNTLLHTGANAGALTESFAVAATDTDGSTDTASLDVTIADDVPTAAADADSVSEDGPTVADGNVIVGSGGADLNTTDGTLDTQGADGATVTAVAFGATAGTVGSALAGAYGSLTLNADGSYTYTLNNAHPLVQGLDGNDTLTETFDYTLTDGDGDTSATTLTITVNGANDVVVINGLDVQGAEEFVDEDDLVDGSSPDATQLTQGGTFTIDSQDGLAALTINGTSVFGAGVVYPVTFSTAYGTMSITGVATTTDANGDVTAATVSYSYTLTDNTLLHTGGNSGALTESFSVVATDSDGSTDTASLDVTIVDDIPTAQSDEDSVTEDGPTAADGNVITGSGGADVNTTDGALDTQGADGATVTAVAFGATAGTVGDPLAGTYGSLTLNANGSYTYTLNNGHPLVQGLDGNDTLTEIFGYTLTDGDGDPSATTLTIIINGANDLVVINGLDGRGAEETVYEDDLTNGSSPDAAQLTQSGTFTVDSPDGLAGLTIDGTPVFGVGVVYPVTFSTAYGTMSITGVATTTDANGDVVAATVSYSYTLDDNTLLHTGANDGSLTEIFAVEATDTDGSTDTASLEVTVVDDVPTANDDTAGQATENIAFTIDALANDVFGADDVDTADPAKVFVATQATYGTVTYDAGTGLFTYAPNSGAGSASLSDSFTYTIIDRDGDTSTATVNVTLLPDSAPVALDVTAKLDDDGLPAGNAASNPAGSDEDQNDVLETGAGVGDERIWTGTLGVSSGGADVPLNFSLASATGIGSVGTEAVVYTWDGATNTLTATVAPPQTRAGLTLFTVKIDDPATGAYTVTLVNPIAHATLDQAAGDDTENNTGAQVQLTYTVDDADTTPAGGDADTGLLTIDFDDDTPSAADYAGATFDEGTGSHTIGDAATILGIVGGADGLTGPLSAIVFTNQGATGGTLAIDGAGQLIYTSPANVTSPTTVTETFSYTVIDKDGDEVTKSVTFGVSDTGISNVSATNELVDEDDIVGANGLPSGPGDDPPVTTGHISFTLGADALQSITLSVISTGLTKLDGVTPVNTVWNGTDTLTGYGGANQADVVFTITLTNITNTGADYDMVLVQPVLHAIEDDPGTGATETSFEDELGFTVDVSVTDVDNSSGTTSFTVTIDDDSPVASDYAGATFAEGTGSHTIGDAAALLGIAGGADGLTGPLSGIVFTNQGATGGTLAINGAGELVYTSPASVTSATTVTETFSYTVTDKDGDAVTQSVTFGVSDTGISNVSATNELVDEDDIVGAGGLASGPGDDPALTTGHISFTLGADALDSITLSTAALGLTKLDGVTTVSTSWDAGSNTLTGYGTSPADVVFTITLSNITATGADYDVVLFQPIKHSQTDNPATGPVESSFEDNLSFTVGVSVEDADGSMGFTGFTVTIDDDSPVAQPDSNTVTEGASVGGNVLTDGTADGFGADGAFVTAPAGGVVGVRAGNDTSTPASGSLGGSGIAGLYGTLTLNADGSYSYDSDPNVISANQQDVFVYTIRDKDGDLSTTTLTISLTAVNLSGVNADVTTHESALDTSMSGSDVAAGSVTGSAPSDTGETATGNVTVAGATSYTIAGGAVAANLTTVVGIYGTLVIDNTNGTFTYTLTSPFTTTPATNNGANTEDNRDSFSYTASDANGNFVGGTITIDIVDDVPNAVTTQNAVVGQVGGPAASSGTFDLDTAVTADDMTDNLGADGGTVRFSSTQTYPDLTSGGEAITYTVSPDGLTLTGSVTAGTVFTVVLDPTAGTPSYTVTMVRTIDVTAQIDFNAGGYNFTGGNNEWTGFVLAPEQLGSPGVVADNNSQDLLLTPGVNGTPNSTVNTTATIGGIGGGASVGDDGGLAETFRVDFVTDLRGDPGSTGGGDYDTPGKRDHVYDGHYTVNGATALFKSSGGSVVKITARIDNDADIVPATTTYPVGDGAIQTITKIQISYFGVSSALLTPLIDDPSLPGANDPQSVTVNGHVFTYRLLADGSVEVGGVAGDGGASLNGTVIAVFTANGYNSIDYTWVSGDSFQIGDFGAAVSVPQPISFALPIELVDGDGDVAASYVDVNLTAWSLVAGVPTSVTQDQSTAGSGQVMIATVAQPHLVGSDFNDTMTGTTGTNVLIGGRGADTMTGLTGSDLFVIDPSHITAASDDTITDYSAGDTIDLRGLFSSMGSQAPTNAAEAAATIRLLGNVLQVDSNGTGAGTTWVAVATLTNSPTTIAVLYQFDQPAISVNSTPPLAVDLDGDGVEFLSTAAGVTFDYAGDGAPEATAWVDGDDGLLAIDRDGDGTVTSGAEIVFGGDGETDLEGLAARYDSNRDGVLDVQDAEFARFGVWQDANENGVSEAGEFRSLSELGITSIGLESDGNSYFAANGDVLVQGEASVTRNGASYALADAAFATATIDRRTAEVVVATAAAGAILTPELAAANDVGANAEEPVAGITLDVEFAASQTGSGPSSGDSARANAARLLDDGVPTQDDDAATAAAHSDEPVMPDSPATTQDNGPDAAPVGLGSEAVADFGGSSGLFQFEGGEALMDALLLSASGDTTALQTQDLAPLREALAEVADEGAVDAIVSRYTDAGAGAAVSVPSEPTSQALIEALDTQLVFAVNGAQPPDPIEDAAQLAAAAQA